MRRLVKGLTTLLTLTGIPYLAYVVFYWVLKPSGSPANKDLNSQPSVSIVLPTYNEADIVEAKLNEIVSLDYPIEKVEVVVVDSSDDETPNLV